MLFAKLDVLFGKYAIYATGGMFLLTCIFGAGWYAANLKLDVAQEKAKNAELRLTVSNQSIASLSSELKSITTTLQESSEQAKEDRANISNQLKALDRGDKSRCDLEARLKAWKPSSACVVPKELKGIWSGL